MLIGHPHSVTNHSSLLVMFIKIFLSFSRFSSKGQVAHVDYDDAQFVPGQWVIFDGDTFGHVWLSLSSFAMFKRVAETFNT